MSVLEPDERQQIVHQARKAAEINKINYDTLVGAGLPERLACSLVFAWSLPRFDSSAVAAAQDRQAAVLEKMFGADEDES